MRLLILLLAALLQSPPGSLEGLAVKAGTTEPVARARVMLTSVEGHLAGTRVVDTDERGRFIFRGVAAGTYRVLVQHDAFVRATGRTVTIASGQSTRDLVIAMTPTGVITGRVVDEYGDPVPDVYVRATRQESVFETTTNDLGEYRLFSVPPGAYIVSAAPYLTPSIEIETTLGDGIQTGRIVVPTRPSPYSPGEGRGLTPLAPVLRAGNFIPFMALRGESQAAVYYPDTTDATAAAPIEVPPGAVIGGINFVTQATKNTK